ncbi:MAG: cation transporter [Parcubacteria group bacterium]|nr:cation transporter [Parcubacteria group bacterium]
MAGHYADCSGPARCWCEVRRLSLVLALTVAILVLEILGGWYSGSLSLLADAGHVFGDGTAIMVAIIAATLVRFRAKTERVIEAAFRINIGLLFLLAGCIAFEALLRLGNPEAIVSPVMVIVAFLGGVGNFFQHRILERAADEHKHKGHRALSLHVLSDLWQSAAVVLGGIALWAGGPVIIDPLLSLGIAAWIVYQGIQLALEAKEEHKPVRL